MCANGYYRQSSSVVRNQGGKAFSDYLAQRTTLPNEAMSLKGKQLGKLSCVPAKFELLISGPVDVFCCFIGLAKIVSRPTCESPFGIHFIDFFSCHASYIAKSCGLSANMQ